MIICLNLLELEVDDSSSSSDDDNESEVVVPFPERHKFRCPLWIKSVTFSKKIPSSVIGKFADLHPELILKHLWNFENPS